MISMFRRPPARRARGAGRVVLRLEGLERRANPSGGPVANPNPVPPAGDQQPPPGGAATNSPPAIVDLAADPIGAGWYMITGRVVDEHPGGLTVTFGGNVATMSGRTTTTDANGNFSVLVCLNTNGTDTGWLLATTWDDAGQQSNEASVYVDP